jgi:hypothetical protein
VEFRTDVFDADSIEGLFDEWSAPVRAGMTVTRSGSASPVLAGSWPTRNAPLSKRWSTGGSGGLSSVSNFVATSCDAPRAD